MIITNIIGVDIRFSIHQMVAAEIMIVLMMMLLMMLPIMF